ncbi:C2H2-type zinc finger protein [Aspergillus undulatus]|uniref:C2H2-type zinc finger protein n=1 Tax=Aspergillus undulatus TaxID=1810928 RepID=UPI003CCCCDA3
MPFQPTMTQPIACPPMEHSPSSFSAYSSYSSNSSYSAVSDDSNMSFLDMYFMHGNPSSSGTSTGPGSVADFPLSHPPSASPLPFEASPMSSDIYYEFNPTFVYTPDAFPAAPAIMDAHHAQAPTSFPSSNPTSSSASTWSHTSMPPEQSIFPPLDGLHHEPTKPAKPYPCTDCGKAFTRPADLKRHQTTVHYPVFQNCPVPDCSRKDSNGFPRRDHLVEHLRSYHHMDVPKRRATKRVKVSAGSF